jgi:hypothetical protein
VTIVEEVQALLRALTRALAAVAAMAAVFTAVNVTGFATTHGIPGPIAILLDPMVALALATVLLADARLSSWGIRPPRWSAALRWFTGITATVMNTWTSLWPDGRIGWPRHADPAGVLLHAVPPVLLVLLTETVAAYRHHINQPHTTPPPPPSPPHLSTPPHPEPETDTPPRYTGYTPHPTEPDAHGRPYPADNTPDAAHPAPPPYLGGEPGVDGDVFARALHLDAEHRARTGRPVSIRRLKKHLHLGQARAQALRTQLQVHHTARTPTAPENEPHPAHQPSTHPSPGATLPLDLSAHP